ncbi:hypothetical protein PDT51_005047 [Salmonella enterica]|nr:hypothetical protein [Salmonella enterica]
MKLISAKESIIMLKRCFVIFPQIAVKVWGFNFTFKSCFLNVFIFLFLCEGIIFSSPAFSTVIYEKNLINNFNYTPKRVIYDARPIKKVTLTGKLGDCALRGVNLGDNILNNSSWVMGLTSHFSGNQTYMENIPVQVYGTASDVLHYTDWGGKYNQVLRSGDSWRKTGIGTGWYGNQNVVFPTLLTIDTGEMVNFNVIVRLCRGDDGSYINAVAEYSGSPGKHARVIATPTSAALQSLVGTTAVGHTSVEIRHVMPSKIEFISNVANTTTDYTLTLPEPVNPNYAGKSYDATFQFEYRVNATKPGNFVIPVNISATYP